MNNARLRAFFLGVIAFVGFWAIVAWSLGESLALPLPHEVIKALGLLLASGAFYAAFGMTLVRLLVAISASGVIAFMLALAAWRVKGFSAFLEPFVGFFRSVPPVVILVALMMLFPMKITPFFLTAFSLVPLLYEMILASFLSIDPLVLDEVKMQASMTPRVFSLVVLPLSLPGILSALLAALGLGFKVMVMGEYLATPSPSIGYSILLASQGLDTATVFAWALVLAVLVVGLDILIRHLQKKLSQ